MAIAAIFFSMAILVSILTERKAAICAHFRQVLATNFLDRTERLPTSSGDFKLVFAKGPVTLGSEPVDPVLGIKAPKTGFVL